MGQRPATATPAWCGLMRGQALELRAGRGNGFSVDLLTFLLSHTPRVQMPTHESCGSSSESRSLQEQELEQAERDADIKKCRDNIGSRGGRALGRQGCGEGCRNLWQKTRRQGEATKSRVEEGWGNRHELSIHGGKCRAYLKSHRR